MTKASKLFGSGGGANPYVSENYYPFSLAADSYSSVLDRWIFFPFVVREDVTIDELFWQRNDTDAGSVNLGILDKDGVAVTDCSSDSDTTVGLHSVSTTPVLLSKDTSYFWTVNVSAAGIAYAEFSLSGGSSDAADVLAGALALTAGTSLLVDSSVGIRKTMTAAPISGTIDMTGCVGHTSIPWGGFRVQ